MQFQEIDKRIGSKLNVMPNMKLSVVWVQLKAAIDDEILGISQWNGALAKTWPDIKKREFAAFLQATRTADNKYLVFPDGSQARY